MLHVKTFTLSTCMIALILIVSLKTSFAQNGADDKTRAILLNGTALSEFVSPGFFNGQGSNDIQTWIQRHGGRLIKDGMSSQNVLAGSCNPCYFVGYKVNHLVYWFGPFNQANEANIALRDLEAVKSRVKAACGEECFIFTFSFAIDGNNITFSREGNLDGYTQQLEEVDRTLKQAEQKLQELGQSGAKSDEMIEEVKETLQDALSKSQLTKSEQKDFEELSEEYGKSSKESGGAGEGGGFLPMKASFSRWFNKALTILAEYLQVKDALEEVLTLAYTIAPELLDSIASTFAEIQNSLTPDALDNTLNDVVDVVDKIWKYGKYAYQFYKDVKKLKALIDDPRFKKLQKKIDVKKAAGWLKENSKAYGVDFDIDKHLPKEFRGLANCIDFNNANDMKDCIGKKMENEMWNAMDKIPGVDKVPFKPSDFRQLKEGKKTFEEMAKEKAKEQICKKLAAGYHGSCEELIEGNYQAAAKGFTEEAIRDMTGIDISQAETIVKNLENGDYEDAAERIINSIPMNDDLRRYAKSSVEAIKRVRDSGDTLTAKEASGICADFLANTTNDPELKEIAQRAKQTTSAFQAFGEKLTEKKIRSALSQAGYSTTEADAVLDGNHARHLLEKTAKNMQIDLNCKPAMKALKAGDIGQAIEENLLYQQGRFSVQELQKQLKQRTANVRDYKNLVKTQLSRNQRDLGLGMKMISDFIITHEFRKY